MALNDHFEVARQGAVAVAEWRAAYPQTRFDLSHADLSGVDLSGCDLRGANLRFAVIEGGWFAGADLSGADFWRARMPGSTLDGARANGARFAWANLESSEFFGADLRGSNLNGADLTDSKFWSASMAGAHLIGANLTHSDLTWTDLRDAQLVYAKLSRSTVRGADFRGTNLRGAGIHILYGMHLQKPLCTDGTKWPEDFVTWDFHWVEKGDFEEETVLVRLRPAESFRDTVVALFRALDRIHRSHGGAGLKTVPIDIAEASKPGRACEIALAAKEPSEAENAFTELGTIVRKVNRDNAVAWGPSTWGTGADPSLRPVSTDQRLNVIAALRAHEEDIRRCEKTIFGLKLKRGQIELPPSEQATLEECTRELWGSSKLAAEADLKRAVDLIKRKGGHVDFKIIPNPKPIKYTPGEWEED